MDVKIRIKILKELKASIVAHREAVLLALKRDLGKSEAEGLLTEYSQVIEEINMAIDSLPHWAKKHRVKTPLTLSPGKSYYVYRPYGTVGIASPWNYPFLLSMVPLISAIAAGNRVILKTSSKTVNTSEIIYSIIRNSIPDYVTYYGLDEDDKNRFIKEDMDMLFFTGSSKVGKNMGVIAADKMIPYVLELGGKSPCVVKKNSKLEVAARRIAWGKTMNSGQTCVAPDYVLVDRGLGEEFKTLLEQSINDFYGNSPILNENYPKIIDKAAMERLKALAIMEGVYNEQNFDFENRKINPHFFCYGYKFPVYGGRNIWTIPTNN